MNISMTNISSTAAEPSLARIGMRMLAALVFCVGLAACDLNEGPAERAGESVDEAATDVGNAIEDACEEGKAAAGADDTRC